MPITALPSSSELLRAHDSVFDGSPLQGGSGSALWDAIAENHRCNCALWEQEDLARRTRAPDSEIVANKRAIDLHNQKRNDAIETIDRLLHDHFRSVPLGPAAKQHSETPGSMADRLSILSLKIHHMRLQTLRSDVSADHIESCASKLRLLDEQRRDLAACLDRFLAEASRGEAFFKIYRQFKMYNDPALNPAIYRESKST